MLHFLSFLLTFKILNIFAVALYTTIYSFLSFGRFWKCWSVPDQHWLIMIEDDIHWRPSQSGVITGLSPDAAHMNIRHSVTRCLAQSVQHLLEILGVYYIIKVFFFFLGAVLLRSFCLCVFSLKVSCSICYQLGIIKAHQ